MSVPALHILAGEHVYDESCDCPRCEDYRQAHCPRCGEPWVAKMRTPADAVCFECRYADGGTDDR